MNNILVQIRSAEQIYIYLQKYNQCFIESTESRVGDLYEYSKKIASLAHTYIMQENGETTGIIIFYCNDKIDKTAYLTMIAVSEENKGKGIGSMLMYKCENDSRDFGMQSLKLEVDINNFRAINFYQRRGFVFLKKASESTIYMKKELY